MRIIKSLGIDLGGHKILAATVENGEITAREEIETPYGRELSAVADAMDSLVRKLDPSVSCKKVGIGVPGMLDRQRETAIKLPNFPGWENLKLGSYLTDRLDRAVFLENDANCYALGEGCSGLAMGMNDYVVLTLGTGIGGGVVSGGELLKGAHGMAGELGHIATGRPGVRCGCGAFGHVEQDAGADGIKRRAHGEGLRRDVPFLWENREYPGEGEIWRIAMDSLARTIATVVHIFDPKLVILGGGISRARGLLEELEPYMKTYVAPAYMRNFKVLVSVLGNDAAVIGAASLNGSQNRS